MQISCTPFILMHSRCENPDLLFDLLYSSCHPDLIACDLNKCASKYLVEQKERIPVIHELVRRNLDAKCGNAAEGSDTRRIVDEGAFCWSESVVVLPPSANQKLKDL